MTTTDHQPPTTDTPADEPPREAALILLPAVRPGDRSALAQTLAQIAWRVVSERQGVVLHLPPRHDKAA